MIRAIPFRGQGRVFIDMALTCGHTGRSEAANDGRTPVRTKAWCVDCQAFSPRATECPCDPDLHWSADKYGNEERIVCGCPCPACTEY